MIVIPACWVKTRCAIHLLEERGYMRALEHGQTQPRPKRKIQVWFRWLMLPAFRFARVYLIFAYILACNYSAWRTVRGTVGKRGWVSFMPTALHFAETQYVVLTFPTQATLCTHLFAASCQECCFTVLLKWPPVSKVGKDFSDLMPVTRQ
jgi:hypothetical protein